MEKYRDPFSPNGCFYRPEVKTFLRSIPIHTADAWSGIRYEEFPERRYKNLILHIPHSSVKIPNNETTKRDKKLLEIGQNLIDFYTDELFVPEEKNEHIESVIFPWCRLCCDVERLPNDPLEKEGLGISYHITLPDGQRHTLSSSENARKMYEDFHDMVIQKIRKGDTCGPGLLLIDCHSFSSLPNLLNANPPQDIDICIGFNEDETKPNKVVIGNIQNYFIYKGYRVGINNPFSNSKTFDVPGGNKYHSVMIEVNKKLYMSEETLEKTDGFLRLHNDIQELYTRLLRK